MNRILIIEDDPAGAILVKRMCEEAGVKPSEFRIAARLEEGLAMAIAQPPDLIIADLVVPPVGEDECIESYLPRLARIAPTGVWTGSVSPNIIMRCHQAGAHFCLIKQSLSTEKCGTARLAQAIADAMLNWKRERTYVP